MQLAPLMGADPVNDEWGLGPSTASTPSGSVEVWCGFAHKWFIFFTYNFSGMEDHCIFDRSSCREMMMLDSLYGGLDQSTSLLQPQNEENAAARFRAKRLFK